jgi:tetratricopeptide (TPR) repeat protein
MRFGRRLRAFALLAGIVGVAPPEAGVAAETSAASGANVAAARKHFERARAYYGQGSYREAIAELEAAHQLDPSAKDLVFNLGVVHEKLADIDDALAWFRLFTTMDLTPQERERADAYVKRLEGAKKELEEKQAAQQRQAAQQQRATPPPQTTEQPAPPAPPPPPVERPPNGRVDGWTVGALGATAAGLAFGIVMAVRAKLDEPAADLVTGPDKSTGTYTTYTDLINRQNTAHREAILADIGFGVAVVGAVATASLFFARPRASARLTTGSVRSTAVSAAPLPGGGALFVQGSF